MSGETFQRRVAMLRDTWAERRHLKETAGAHDFASQLALLQTIYGWVEGATADIHAVYGDELPLSLSAAPAASGPHGFSVTVAESSTVSFALSGRRRASGPTWSITVTVGSGGPLAAAGPDRRNGRWTKARLEDVLLGVLGAYERTMSERLRGIPHGNARLRGA